MCFAPQRRTIFGHRNFKKWPESVVFWAFWLANVLRATAACNFSGSKLPKLLRDCGVLCILTEKCASRHSGVRFLDIGTSKIGPSVNVLCATAACHFSPGCWTGTSAPAALARLLFEHQEPRIIEKTQRFSASLAFRARVPAFYWLYTRVDLLSADLTSLFCLTPLLCFSTLRIVGS